MTERDFLDAQSRRIRGRLRHGSTEIHDRLERSFGHAIREHPRTAVAVGASAGVLLGGLLGPALRAGSGKRPGILRGALGLVRGTGLYALRAGLAKSILAAVGPAEPREPTR